MSQLIDEYSREAARRHKGLTSLHHTVIAIAIIATILVLGLYWNWLGHLPVSSDPSAWGHLGDYMGGVLNPLLSFLALITLLRSLLVQHEELQATKQELARSTEALVAQSAVLKTQEVTQKLQRFENTFFHLLDLYKSVLDSIEHTTLKGEFDTSGQTVAVTKRGRDRLGELAFGGHHEMVGEKYVYVHLTDIKTSNDLSIYNEFYEFYEPDLGQYFRIIYNILKFVHNSDIENKRDYTNLLRAQLSSTELLLLLLNALSQYGEGARNYYLKYNLLKHLPDNFQNMPIAQLKSDLLALQQSNPA